MVMKIIEKVEDMGLNRKVERRKWLVEEEDLRV